MNTTGWIVLIVVIAIIVIIIVVIALTAGRRRKRGLDRQRAEELRAAARDDDLAAREREAKASRANADAQQAGVEAERRRRDADAHAAQAGDARASVDRKLSRADEIDPDVDTHRFAQKNHGADQTENRAGSRAEEGTEHEAEPRHARSGLDEDVTGDSGDADVPPPRPAR
ncbi:hypothetical protein GCM10028798_28030 [Humibacter antri]